MLMELFPVFRFAGRAALLFGLLAFVAWVSSLYVSSTNVSTPGQSVLLSLTSALVSFALVFAVWLLMRPVRYAILRVVYRLMIHSGISVLLYFGIWELLTDAVRVRLDALPDYTGLATLHRTYDSVDQRKRTKIISAVRRLAESQRCNVFKDAIMFLDGIEIGRA